MMSDIEKNELNFIRDTRNWKFGTVENCTEFENYTALSSITSILSKYFPDMLFADVKNTAITVMNGVVYELYLQNKKQNPVIVDPLTFKDLMILNIFLICGVAIAKEYVLTYCNLNEAR